jgi:PadR family transcriptional regulator PadR
MNRQDSLQGSLPVLVLKILARCPAWVVRRRSKAFSDQILRVEESSLCPALHRMEEAGWIKAKWLTTENKRRKRIARGRKQLEEQESRWRTVTAAVVHVLQRC